jgi:hypothetical protein
MQFIIISPLLYIAGKRVYFLIFKMTEVAGIKASLEVLDS